MVGGGRPAGGQRAARARAGDEQGQLTALGAAGITVPRTRAVIGSDRLIDEARRFPSPFVTKHNQGGKGLGVARFDDADVLARALADGELAEPADHTWLLQEYVEPAEGFITRVEIVGGAFLYALAADTSHGFQLCPADACQVHDEFCPSGAHAARIFRVRDGFAARIFDRYLRFARAWGIEIAGLEFIETSDGREVTYDVNTNYNAVVDAEASRSGAVAVARFLAGVLREQASDRGLGGSQESAVGQSA